MELMSRDDVLRVRRAIIDAIMATDMSVHLTHLNRFSQRSFAKSGLVKDDDPHEVLAFVLHAVDMGGQCSPPDQAKIWSDRILNEFADQAREEAELGLPRTPHLQNLHRPVKQAQVRIDDRGGRGIVLAGGLVCLFVVGAICNLVVRVYVVLCDPPRCGLDVHMIPSSKNA
jgi:hypothetical protein